MEAEPVRSDHGSLDQGLTTPWAFLRKGDRLFKSYPLSSFSLSKKKMLTLAFLRHKVFTDVIELN